MPVTKILIRQPAGIGDILFLQKLIDEIVEETGLEVIYPLKPNLFYLKDYINSKATFVSEDDDFEFKSIYNTQTIIQNGDVCFFPIQDFNHMFSTGDIMKIKYDAFGKDWKGWQNSIRLIRNHEREQKLWDYLKLENKKYILTNKNFGTPPDSLQIQMNINTELPLINMDYLGFDNVFDWIKVFENAEEIHTVETSVCYIMECIDLKTDKVYMHKRGNQNNFNYIDGIYNKFIKHE